MGHALASWLPDWEIQVFGQTWSLNPGPWSGKEHALVVMAYWGSSYTAYGLGPLSAMELFYNKRLSALWAITFLLTTQFTGYALVGLYRRILVRPPHMYYPGVLPTVSLFNAMHKNPHMAASSLRFFIFVALATFTYQWLPSFMAPVLSSLPLLCWAGRGSWKAFVLGSGSLGFGFMDLSLDWNYVAFLSPLFTPLWANVNRFLGAAVAIWITYPVAYFSNILDSKRFPPMSSRTFDASGQLYNVTSILTSSLQLNQTALGTYSMPQWSFSYAMHFFWAFASAAAMLSYAVLFHGRSTWQTMRSIWTAHENKDQQVEDDPYLQITAHHPTIPRHWYAILLTACLVLATIQLYAADMQLPWWGLILIFTTSALFTLPCGMLFGTANIQIGMEYVAEIMAGAFFPGRPIAVLTATVYGRQILEQCLNLASDLKLGFYLKIPERALFIAQVYGTLLGPFVNWICMRLIIDTQGAEALLATGNSNPTGWDALKTKNFFSVSVIWGILGPAKVLGPGSPYRWLYLGFGLGIVAVLALWLAHKARPRWQVDRWPVHPAIIFHGAALFPLYPTTNLTTSMIAAVSAMGLVQRVNPRWFARYNYLLGAGLDCGAQLMQMVLAVAVLLLNREGTQGLQMPNWWGNDATHIDRCFPPPGLPPAVMG